jgi:hypothetical protein
MDNLSSWALSIIAVAVGLMPGVGIISARLIAGLLHRVLWPRPEEARCSPDVSRYAKSRLALQPHQGDEAARTGCRPQRC